MRRIRFTPEAERTLASQIGYLIDQGAIDPAQALKDRVERTLKIQLRAFLPLATSSKTGKFGKLGFREPGLCSGIPLTTTKSLS